VTASTYLHVYQYMLKECKTFTENNKLCEN